jgi:DNA-binding transcriptional ArsR family regulator
MSREKKQDLIFKALADTRRRKILDLLKKEERTTGDICAHFRTLDRCTIMQHLKVLEKAELIIVRREGRLRWNYLNAVPVREIYDRWISQYADFPVELLTKLKHDLESDTKKI